MHRCQRCYQQLNSYKQTSLTMTIHCIPTCLMQLFSMKSQRSRCMVVMRVWLNNQTVNLHSFGTRKKKKKEHFEFESARWFTPSCDNWLEWYRDQWPEGSTRWLIIILLATSLIKGCRVHWIWSYQRIADKVVLSQRSGQSNRNQNETEKTVLFYFR